jgi:hypothetical protein
MVWPVIGAVLAGLDGIGQAGGVGLLLESVFMQTREPAPKSPALSRSHLDFSYHAGTAENPVWLRPVPYQAGRDGIGLGVVGIF